MLNIQTIRDNRKMVKENLKSKGADETKIDEIFELDAEYRKQIQVVEELKSQRNAASKQIGTLKREGKETTEIMNQVNTIGAEIDEKDQKVKDLKDQIQSIIETLPNLLDASVPFGVTEDENVELKVWGEPTKFDFEPIPHWDLVTELGLVDFENGAKLTGSRFVVYTRTGARLVRALISFMLDTHIENGYEEIMTPAIANKESMYASGQLPKFEEDAFKLRGEREMYLIPTAEVTLTNMYRDDIIDGEALPINFTSHTPCFRQEAGSAGRDTRGLIRHHQFDKVELVHFAKPEESAEVHEKLRAEAELILEKLELPYRTITLCTGDTGFSAAKTYDVEVWLPSYDEYKEISSCSNCTDFQARRGNIRYRKEDGKLEYVHTLNGSGLAVGRTFAAIVENYQNEDGTITVPKALIPYMGGLTVIK